MAGQEEPDRVVFALQPLGRQPRLAFGNATVSPIEGPPNSSFWPTDCA
jgi:hypothetical protein